MKVVRFIVGLFAIIGGVAVAAAIIFLVLLLIPPGGGPAGSSVPSPNGKFKSVWIQWAGGGGLSPFCSSVIYVAPTSGSDEEVQRARSYYRVFESDCDLFGDHDGSKVEWLSDTNLKIEFSTTSHAHGVTLRGMDASQTVQISFSIRNRRAPRVTGGS